MIKAAVEIRFRQGLGSTVIAVKDDGSGFFGALGLGAAIAAGFARGLGGSWRWYRRLERADLLAVLIRVRQSGGGPGPARQGLDSETCRPPIVDGEGAGAGALTEETLLASLGAKPRGFLARPKTGRRGPLN